MLNLLPFVAGRRITVELSGAQLLTFRLVFENQVVIGTKYQRTGQGFQNTTSKTHSLSVYCHCLLARQYVWEIGYEKDVFLFKNNLNSILFPMPPLPEPWTRRYAICFSQKWKIYMYINTHVTEVVLELGRANKESIFRIPNMEIY